MKVSWRIWKGVEAQAFEPDAQTREAILFCPGFPGMGGTVFEQRHAAAFAELGYAVYVIKHKGTKLSGALAPVMVNNGARMMQARERGETHLGGGAATIDEWLTEPLEALRQLDGAYDKIHIIGNSFGALAALWSMTESGAPIGKVEHVILYAGAQGIDDGTEDGIMRLWKPEYLMVARITEKVTLNNAFDVVDGLKKMYGLLPARAAALPEKVKISYVVVERDELLRLSDTQKFDAAIGARGTIIMDDYDVAWPGHGYLAHDTPEYKTEDLLKVIRG
ncbi:MAG: hypothetical protein DI626_02450 [Micavibrio aeruginosavorus]|uniref:Alpha/beta hydrolase n=1 Tax=Micavibrio aeruginosavorus TaxID=349221 RepID=A0A2W5BYK6_9BACT|nr:MAG: hypothetical protein DI626_02450 [Micavibrio aeruginosavorus]